MKEQGLYLVGIRISPDQENADFYLLYVLDSDIHPDDSPVMDSRGSMLFFRSPAGVADAMAECAERFHALGEPPMKVFCVYDFKTAISYLFDPEAYDSELLIVDCIILLLDCVIALDPDFSSHHREALLDMQRHMTGEKGGRNVSTFFSLNDYTRDDIWSAICAAIGLIIANSRVL